MTDFESVRPCYCPECGYDFGIGVDEDDKILVICECDYQPISEFGEELESQLPLESSSPEKINYKSSDDKSSKGFQ